MKFTTVTLALLTASANAATYTDYLEQNALCGDSQDCVNRCRDGRYHVVKDTSNNVYFGCSQKANNEFYQGYDNPDCRFGSGDGKGEVDQSRATCSAVGGKLCQKSFLNGETVNYCVIVHEDAAKFNDACKASNGTANTHNVDLTYDIVVNGCK